MSRAKGGSDGRTPASGQISVPKPNVWRVTNNWRGDVGEAAFAYKAMKLGYVVSKPLGNIHRYDYVVEGSGKLRPKEFIRKRYYHRDPYARYLNARHELGEPSGPEF